MNDSEKKLSLPLLGICVRKFDKFVDDESVSNIKKPTNFQERYNILSFIHLLSCFYNKKLFFSFSTPFANNY